MLTSLGYDSIVNGNTIVVFDLDNIVRANNLVHDTVDVANTMLQKNLPSG